jgi:ATP-dependent helicase/nuclease subunit A
MFLTSNQLRSLDLSKNLSVKANAGSGKTAVLVERFVRILLRSDIKQLDSIVGITFTEKAANELRNRIFKKLWSEVEKTGVQKNIHLSNLLERISSLQIGTIHSFCSSILREFANEAELDSGFTILQGMDEVIMMEEVIEETLRSIINLEPDDPDRKELEELIKIFGLKKVKSFLKEFMNERETVTLLSEKIYNKDSEEICKFWIDSISDFTDTMMKESGLIDYLTERKSYWEPKLTEFITLFHTAKSLQERCYYFDLMVSTIYLKSSGEIKKTFLKKNEAGSEIDFIAIYKRMKKIANFSDFTNFFSSPQIDYTPVKYQIEITKKLINIFVKALTRYKHQKDMNAQLDFEDLLIRTRDLLKDKSISAQLKERFKYILVDEYQDTNHLQSQILYSLLDESAESNLFIVGDPKQSIYGFRNAEVEIFDETEKIILDERSGEKILLDESFRLLSDIVVFINYIFKKISGSNPFEKITYQELIKARPNDAKGKIELLLYHGNEKTENIEEEMISRRILELITAKQEIYDIGSDEARTIEYGDIAVLLRSRTHIDSLEKTFIKNDIPYIITSGIGYYQTQEIFDLYNYLSFLINPKNDLALVGVLRSPFFYISDTLLFEISGNGNNMMSFWEKVLTYCDSLNPENSVLSAVKVLMENTDISQRISIPNLINKIITETNWYAVLSFQENGKQTLANLRKFMVIAREFEKKGFNTLFDFVEKLTILVNEEEKEGQAVIDPTNQMVKIMTIHAAKGLEFPVLFLPYSHQDFKPDTEPYFNKTFGIGLSVPQSANLDIEYDHSIASKYIKALNRLKSDSEEKRVLYVAFTRAHNLLFVSGKYEPFKNGRNYLTWIKEALGLDDLYIETAADESNTNKMSDDSESSKKEKDTVNYPFFKSNKILIKDRLVSAKIHDEEYIRSVEEYELNIDLIQGLQVFDAIPLVETAEKENPVYEIAEKSIPRRVTENVLSATAMQTYIDCPVKYYLRYTLGFPEALSSDISYNLFEESNEAYSIDEHEINAMDPDVFAETDSPVILSGTMRGKILHSALEQIDNVANGKISAEDLIIKKISEYYFTTKNIQKKDIVSLTGLVNNFIKTDIYGSLSGYNKSINEFILSVNFDGDILTGVIDRICIDGNNILIVDYKTNKTGGKKLDSFRKIYSNQMLFYAYLTNKYYKNVNIESVLIFLEKPEDIVFEKYSTAKLQSFENVLKKTLSGISDLENGIKEPEKKLSNCSFCDYFNGNRCVY